MKKLPTILQNLIYITYLAELLPLILCLIFLKKIKTIELKVFLYYLLVFSIFLLISIYFRRYLKDSPHQILVNRIFLITEFSFLSLFYYHNLILKAKKILLSVSVVLFFIYSVYDFALSKTGEFSFIPLVIECLFFLILIILFFYENLKYNISSFLYTSAIFWISIGFLIYFSGNFFLFLFSKTMFSNPEFRFQYTIIYGTVTIIKNIFICTGIIVNTNSSNNQNSNNKTIDIDLGTFNPLSQHTNL